MHSSHNNSDAPYLDSFSLLVLRAGVAIALCFFHLIPEATTGWEAIWNEESWPLAEFVAGFGVPQTKWVLASLLVLAFLAAVGLTLGFLIRFSASLLLVGAIVSGITAVREESVEGLELSIVHGLVLLFFLLRGAGAFSGDHYFANRRSD